MENEIRCIGVYMVWKKDGNKWTLYIDGEVAGYIVLVRFKNGYKTYQGIAMNKKTKAVSKSVTSENRTTVQNAVEKMARAQRK